MRRGLVRAPRLWRPKLFLGSGLRSRSFSSRPRIKSIFYFGVAAGTALSATLATYTAKNTILCNADNNGFTRLMDWLFPIPEEEKPENMTAFLPPKIDQYAPRLTLLIDMEEVLLKPHYDIDHGSKHLKRAGALWLVQNAATLYEVVIWSDAAYLTAGGALDSFDPQRFAMHRLFRAHTKEQDGKRIKDVAKLGRDPKTVVVLTTDPEKFIHAENQIIQISTFTEGIPEDDLIQIWPFLDQLAMSNPDDVRTVIAHWNGINIAEYQRNLRNNQ